MFMMQSANLLLRFLLELCILAALCDWGFRTGQGILVKLLLGIGVPLVIAFIWGLCGAPKSQLLLSGLPHLLLEILVFGMATLALWKSGHSKMALSFAVISVINRLLMFVWGQ